MTTTTSIIARRRRDCGNYLNYDVVLKQLCAKCRYEAMEHDIRNRTTDDEGNAQLHEIKNVNPWDRIGVGIKKLSE
jgi:hypothetical protein